MYKPQILQKILFIDIETAGISADFRRIKWQYAELLDI